MLLVYYVLKFINKGGSLALVSKTSNQEVFLEFLLVNPVLTCDTRGFVYMRDVRTEMGALFSFVSLVASYPSSSPLFDGYLNQSKTEKENKTQLITCRFKMRSCYRL